MQEVKISSSYRITIPKRIRDKLGILPGERFAISESDDGMVITRVPANPADFLCGIFKTEPSMTHDLLLDRKED